MFLKRNFHCYSLLSLSKRLQHYWLFKLFTRFKFKLIAKKDILPTKKKKMILPEHTSDKQLLLVQSEFDLHLPWTGIAV
jgi:hypothetical protein